MRALVALTLLAATSALAGEPGSASLKVQLFKPNQIEIDGQRIPASDLRKRLANASAVIVELDAEVDPRVLEELLTALTEAKTKQIEIRGKGTWLLRDVIKRRVARETGE
jgi:biopolymer transport protein ExbD